MFKKLKIKKLISLLLIFLLSINNFAAVVSDNDGIGFVTKGEFDELKNNFATQINDYNDSLTNKIDGAIAEYIAGKTVYEKNAVNPIVAGVDKIYCVDEDRIFEDWDWKGGQLHTKQTISWIVGGDSSRYGGWIIVEAESPAATNFTKLVIDEQEDKTGTKQPYWWGYTTDAQEDIESSLSLGENGGGFTTGSYGGHLHLGGWRNDGPDGEFTGTDFKYYFLLISSYADAASTTTKDTAEYPGTVIPSRDCFNIANFTWGKQQRKNIITWHDADTHFSVKDSTKYWRNSNTDPTDSDVTKSSQMASCKSITGYYVGATRTSTVGVNAGQYPSGGLTGDVTHRICFGFHPTYKKFSQLVMKDYSDITVPVGDGKTVDLDKINPYSGWPLCASKTDYRIEFTVDFEDKTKDYIVTASDTKFSLVDSGNVTGNLQISADGGKTFANTVTVNNGHGTITYDNRSGNNHVIWLKWSFASGKGGGVLNQPNDIQDVKID